MTPAAPIQRRRAMTLIELLLVIVVLGVLMAIGLPRLTGTNERAALTTTARDMARLAAYARQSAISQQARTMIHFDEESRMWQLELPAPTDSRRAKRGREKLLSDEEQPHTLHDKVLFQEFQRDGEKLIAPKRGGITVEFYPNGTSNGLTIVLATKKGRQMSVAIERATGRVSAYDGPPMTFGDMVAAAGGDVSQYAGAEVTIDPDALPAGKAKDNFYRLGESSDERTSRYEDAAARIMGRVTKRFEEAEGKDAAQSPQGGNRP